MRRVGVEDMLRARDARAERQRLLREKHGCCVITLTMNIAGEIKLDEEIERAFEEGVRRVEEQLLRNGERLLERIRIVEFTGCECCWAATGEAAQIKRWLEAVEEMDALGRLFDADVQDAQGMPLSRKQPRGCLICGENAKICGRSRRHSGEELYFCAKRIIREHFAAQRAAQIGRLAEQALLLEALVTPKPGLVDRENSGAHRDMDIFSFAMSAAALRSYFETCTRIGMRGGALDALRLPGRRAEEEMLRTTGGANTHKGAIFSLGILCCAAAMEGELFENAARIAHPALEELRQMQNPKTAGELQYAEFGFAGVRGEAAAGFPSVRSIALPALKEAILAGKSLNDAGLAALLRLMASVRDSNVLKRGGMAGQQSVWRAARSAEPTAEELRRMNEDFTQMNLSPGGCADLLAAAYFAYFLEKNER